MPVLAFSTDRAVPHPAWLPRAGIRYLTLTTSACQAIRDLLGCDHGCLRPEHVPRLAALGSAGALDGDLEVLIAVLTEDGDGVHVRIA